MESTESFPNLVLVVHDNAPLYKEPFLRSLMTNLHVPIGPDTQIAAHQSHNAERIETATGFAVALATRYLRQRSMELQVDRTVYEKFKTGSPLEDIQGFIFRFYAKA